MFNFDKQQQNICIESLVMTLFCQQTAKHANIVNKYICTVIIKSTQQIFVIGEECNI